MTRHSDKSIDHIPSLGHDSALVLDSDYVTTPVTTPVTSDNRVTSFEEGGRVRGQNPQRETGATSTASPRPRIKIQSTYYVPENNSQ